MQSFLDHRYCPRRVVQSIPSLGTVWGPWNLLSFAMHDSCFCSDRPAKLRATTLQTRAGRPEIFGTLKPRLRPLSPVEHAKQRTLRGRRNNTCKPRDPELASSSNSRPTSQSDKKKIHRICSMIGHPHPSAIACALELRCSLSKRPTIRVGRERSSEVLLLNLSTSAPLASTEQGRPRSHHAASPPFSLCRHWYRLVRQGQPLHLQLAAYAWLAKGLRL